MRTTLTTIAQSIADQVYYGGKNEQNVVAELEYSDNWLCLIDKTNRGTGVTGASHEVKFMVSFAFVKAVPLEDNAIFNDETMMASYAKCTAMLNGIIKSGTMAKLPAWGIEEVKESEYDINCIGYRINIELTPINFTGIC